MRERTAVRGPALAVVLLGALSAVKCAGQPFEQVTTDIAELVGVAGVERVWGSPEGNGSFGVPVAAGLDTDGDGNPDYMMAAFQASPQGRFMAGQVYLFLRGWVDRKGRSISQLPRRKS